MVEFAETGEYPKTGTPQSTIATYPLIHLPYSTLLHYIQKIQIHVLWASICTREFTRCVTISVYAAVNVSGRGIKIAGVPTLRFNKHVKMKERRKLFRNLERFLA